MEPPSQQSLPPRTSGLAIFSLVTSFLLLGIIPVICGHVALSQIRKSGGLLKGRGIAIAGLTIGYITIALGILAIPVLFIGARAWKKGSDRAYCIMYHRSVQQAVRQYESDNHLKPGDPIDWSKVMLDPSAAATGRKGCPTGGTYTLSSTIPPVGELVVKCPHESDENRHEPVHHETW
ncbi:MAG: DUF4190 domain-containing protein [Luteolibacter sp.]